MVRLLDFVAAADRIVEDLCLAETEERSISRNTYTYSKMFVPEAGTGIGVAPLNKRWIR